MNKFCRSTTKYLCNCWLIFWLLAFCLLISNTAWGDNCTSTEDNGVNFDACNTQLECQYRAQRGTTTLVEVINALPDLADDGSEINTTWTYMGKVHNTGTSPLTASSCDTPETSFCSQGGTADQSCFRNDDDRKIDIVTSGNTEMNTVVLQSDAVGVGFNAGDRGCFQLRASRVNNTGGSTNCSRNYTILLTDNVGGWGDPHIKTIDGTRYDFQSAGEFIALRGDGIEIQTRQSPVSTQNISFRNSYTGLRNCVARYTAVAALVGKHRVTIQPNLSGAPNPNGPDPAGPQIRVDGELKTLGPDGIDLSSCNCSSKEVKSAGRIVRAADEQSIEIHYANGTKVVVVPRWWGEPIHTWFFNVEVYDTTANQGIMGRIADGSWLPALSDGSTVGSQPDENELEKRYEQLYVKFANSWRVGGVGKPSLFDYDGNTSTDTFKLEEWPRHEPDSCLLAGEPEVKPTTQAVAEEACKDVVDKHNRENCIFDVVATGYTGFAGTYERSEQLIPGATRTTLAQDKTSSEPGETVTFTATVQRTVSTIGKVTSGRVRFIVDGKSSGEPIKFDSDGNAVLSTSTLANGSHEVEARFLPTGFGERFRPSSDKVKHVVSRDWWLSFHAGRTIPTGNVSDNYDASYSYVLDLEYKFTPKYSFLGLLGQNRFEGASTGVDDTYWTNLSANLKYYYMHYAKNGMIWANAGAGIYKPESGSSRAGTNIGIGIGDHINPRLRWEVDVNYHYIFTSGSDTKFIVPTVGVSYSF